VQAFTPSAGDVVLDLGTGSVKAMADAVSAGRRETMVRGQARRRDRRHLYRLELQTGAPQAAAQCKPAVQQWASCPRISRHPVRLR
jgi:hypothetical protein